MFERKIQDKIKSIDEAIKVIGQWKMSNCKKVVFTNGCFDIIHRGHVDYLSKARDLGDKLIIGLNSDESVKRLKGETRPLQNEYSRALILASFIFCDLVVIFNEDTPYELINKVSPDVLVKGGDYTKDNIVGAEIVIARGGEVTTIPFIEGHSSSNIISKL